MRIEKIAITGADIDADGAMTIEHLAVATMRQEGESKSGKAYTLTVEGAEADGLFLPDPQSETAPLVAPRPSLWKIGPLTLVMLGATDGAAALTIERMEGHSEPDASRQAVSTSARIVGMHIDAEAMDDSELDAKAADIDVKQFDVALSFASNWNSTTGRLQVDQWRLEAPGLGAFDLQLSLDGYTGEKVRQMRDASLASKDDQGDSAEAMRQAGKQMMAALGDISLSAAQLRFEDDSLTHKVLEARAKSDGQTVEELVAMLPDMSLSFTQMLDMPEFSQHIADALRTFLSDPKSMTIKLHPAAPAPVAGMIGMALFSPAALIEQLGVEITANE